MKIKKILIYGSSSLAEKSVGVLKDEYDSAFKVRAEAVQKMAAQRQQMAQQEG